MNGTHTFDATVHFVDEDGQTPNIRVGAFDATIADIFIRHTGEVEIFAKSNGSTDVTLTATDPSGGIAAKRFTVIVEQSEAPVVATNGTGSDDATWLAGNFVSRAVYRSGQRSLDCGSLFQ